jgi:D-lactate dehydrogenase
MARGSAKSLARLARHSYQQYLESTRSITTKAGRGTELLENAAARSGVSQVRGSAVATAQAVQTGTKLSFIPEVKTDLYGAVSVVSPHDEVQEGVYKNVDGHRFDDGRYQTFMKEVNEFITKDRVYTDPVRTFAYGTDASFYRLNPKMVVKIHSEADVRRVLPIAQRLGVPVTFRAAGTSLSGQAITDSVLLKLSHTGKNFRNYEVHVRPHTIRPRRSCPGPASRTHRSCTGSLRELPASCSRFDPACRSPLRCSPALVPAAKHVDHAAAW